MKRIQNDRNIFRAILVLSICYAVPVFATNRTIVNRETGLSSNQVTSIAPGREGIWVGTSAGVSLISPSGMVIRNYGAADSLPPGKVISLALFKGKVYAGTVSGLGVFDGTSWRPVLGPDTFNLSNSFLEVDSTGEWLWVGAANTNGGLLRYDGQRWEFKGGDGRGRLNNVRSFAFEGETVWLGTGESGVYRRTDTGFHYFREGLPSTYITSLILFDGTLWAGTLRGAARYIGGQWTPLTRSDGFPLSAVSSMSSSPESLYIAGPEGVFRYREGRYDPLPKDLAPKGKGGVIAILYADGTLYTGTSGGLLMVRGW